MTGRARKEARKGNDCNTCERRFSCLTSREKEFCPIIVGEDIDHCYPFYNNMKVNLVGDYSYFTPQWQIHSRYAWYYRIKTKEILKLLRKAKFRTVKKYDRIYLEVIE